MTFTERINLLLYKKQCIRVIITDTNKRVTNHIVKIDDKKMFTLGERKYIINFNSVFMSGGIPTYFYYIDNPNSISKKELRLKNEPLDPRLASKRIEISATELHDAIEETISRKIIRYAEDGDQRIINAVYIMGGINLLAIAGVGYFLYTLLDQVVIFINDNQGLLQAIRDMLLNGVGN